MGTLALAAEPPPPLPLLSSPTTPPDLVWRLKINAPTVSGSMVTLYCKGRASRWEDVLITIRILILNTTLIRENYHSETCNLKKPKKPKSPKTEKTENAMHKGRSVQDALSTHMVWEQSVTSPNVPRSSLDARVHRTGLLARSFHATRETVGNSR